MAEVAKLIRVTGEVQGVFFRVWTRQKADELGLSGWVRNVADGSVEAHLQGDGNRVAELIVAIGRGPDQARVETMQVNDAETAPLEGFAIRP